MYDILAIGELLIDFSPIITPRGVLLKQNAGGAPCNMLTMAQNLGSKTAFIGKVGQDQFGKFLGNTLEHCGIDTSGLVYSKEYNTTLAFVHIDDNGERGFSFYRKNCADIKLSNEDIKYDLIDNSKIVHFGSLSFTDEPSKTTVEEVIKYAKSRGKIITYDPNYRPALWDGFESAKVGMTIGLKYADIIKVSYEELRILTDETDLEKAAKKLYDLGIGLVCITLGDKGSFFYHRNGSGIIEGFRSKVIDTTGAGDAFFGCLVHKINEHNCRLEDLSIESLKQMLKFSNAAASLCVERLGGIPSMPTLEKINERLN